MDTTTVAVDLAKDVFEVAISGDGTEHRRLTRTAFTRFLANQPGSQVVMEACGSAHHWARVAQSHGHRVRLLPAQYVRPYRRRNKTDRADCAALLEAVKNPEIRPVVVKTVDQQVIQGLHRIRSGWMATRTARINTMRGLLRELGITIPQGAALAVKRIAATLDQLPVPLGQAIRELTAEVRELETHIEGVERQLAQLSRENPTIQRLQQISGIGLLTATALSASAGSARHFQSGRHFASWLGLTPREFSSGNTRRIGHLSKRGDVYVRMLLTHGARSVLTRARTLQRSGHPLNRLQQWAVELEQRRGHNKATCALANKLARIAWATWYYERDFNPNHAQAA
jgi:transposase